MASSSEGGAVSGSSWIGHTKPFLRSKSKPKADSNSSNTDQQSVVDQLPQHESGTDGGTSELLNVTIDRDTVIKVQLAEKSYREHALKTLVRRQNSSELSELGEVNGVGKLLGTDLCAGLGIVTDREEERKVMSEQQLEKELDLRRRAFGTNVDVPALPVKQSLLWKSFKQSFLSDDSIVYILSRGCIVLLIILGVVAGPVESISPAYGPALLVIQFILDAIVWWSTYRMSHLLNTQLCIHKNVDMVRAIRCGRKRAVSAQDLVVGDLVELKSGDRIPADGLLVEGHGFEIDCHACPHNSTFLTSGCFVQSGLGLMLITAVGEEGNCLSPAESSCSSTVADEDVTKTEPALLRRVGKFNAFIQRLKLSISVMFMCIFLPFYFSGNYSSNPSGKFRRGHRSAIVVIYNIVNEFYGSLTFVTVVVPDTVSQAVRNSLGSFFQRILSAQRASICNLEKCESKLGFVTTICTGKRNVLTLDRMDVHSFWIAGVQCPSDRILLAAQYNPSMNSAIPEDIRELLSEAVALNYTTGYYANKGSDSKISEDSYESAIEKALLRWGQDILGINFDSVRGNCTTSSMEFFEPMKMRSGVAIQRRGSSGKCVLHWKGAAEIMLPSCTTTWLRAEAGGRAELVSLSEEQLKKNIEGIASSMEKIGLSCVALVYSEEALGETRVEGAAGANIKLKLDASLVPSTSSSPGKAITLLALVGMKQTLKPEAREAVQKAKDAGIRVIMATGDSLPAARAMAKESGIIENSSEVDLSDKVVHASAFEAWDASERAKNLEKLAVMARASGYHKLQLLENLQTYNDAGRKEVIAVTGYKVTDGPALKKADVAFSWNSGVQAAYKGSLDVILPDDAGFESLYKAIESARCMRYNIQYYFHFQATLSFAAALTTGLSTMQSQWINLMTALATIALTVQRAPTSSLSSDGAPVPSVDEPLFRSYTMWRNVALQAAYQVILFNWMIYYETQKLQDTVIFNTLIFCQVINVVNARQSLLPKGFLCHTYRPLKVLPSLVKNEWLLVIMIVAIAGVQVVLIKYLGDLLSTQPLNWAQWRLCVGLALPTWFIAVLGKWL